MFRNMVTSLLKHDRIKTTDAKAKELRRWADHIVTLAKRGDLHARRLAMAIVREKDVVHKIFEEAPKRFGAIHGGYTRIVKIGRRPGDTAPLTLVELVSSDAGKPGKTKKIKAKTATKPAVNAETTAAKAAVADTAEPTVEAASAKAETIESAPPDIEPDALAADDSSQKDAKASTDPAGTAK